MATQKEQSGIRRKLPPTLGNYVGGTYTVGALLASESASGDPAAGEMLDGAEVAAFEGQSSGVVAPRGAVLLDYLRAVVPDERYVWDELNRWLGPMMQRAGGWRGWYDRSALVLDGGVVAWCSQRDAAERQGVVVDLPGRACAQMGAALGSFLSWVCDVGRVTRCDWALDDREGRLTLARIRKAEAEGGMVSRWHGLTVLERCERGQSKGWTVYMGSRRSEAMVRVYDKAAEQRGKGREVVGDWVRCELECKGAFADAIAREVLREGNMAVVGQLNRRLRFAVPSGGDLNHRRWLTCGWWAAFVGSVVPGPALLCGEVPECTVSSLAAYVERAAGPALATVLAADYGDLDRLFGIIERSERRLKPRHRAALALAGVA